MEVACDILFFLFSITGFWRFVALRDSASDADHSDLLKWCRPGSALHDLCRRWWNLQNWFCLGSTWFLYRRRWYSWSNMQNGQCLGSTRFTSPLYTFYDSVCKMVSWHGSTRFTSPPCIHNATWANLQNTSVFVSWEAPMYMRQIVFKFLGKGICMWPVWIKAWSSTLKQARSSNNNLQSDDLHQPSLLFSVTDEAGIYTQSTHISWPTRRDTPFSATDEAGTCI
jgi:hypothetical protein